MVVNSNVLASKEIASTDKLIYIILDHNKNKEGFVMMSYQQISEKIGVSKRTAMRSIETLVQTGMIKKENVVLEYNQNVNRYKIIYGGEGNAKE
jgi:DNA-binding Lrp family transcriptional regulator